MITPLRLSRKRLPVALSAGAVVEVHAPARADAKRVPLHDAVARGLVDRHLAAGGVDPDVALDHVGSGRQLAAGLRGQARHRREKGGDVGA
jgi:hypothetical protein